MCWAASIFSLNICGFKAGEENGPKLFFSLYSDQECIPSFALLQIPLPAREQLLFQFCVTGSIFRSLILMPDPTNLLPLLFLP